MEFLTAPLLVKATNPRLSWSDVALLNIAPPPEHEAAQGPTSRWLVARGGLELQLEPRNTITASPCFSSWRCWAREPRSRLITGPGFSASSCLGSSPAPCSWPSYCFALVRNHPPSCSFAGATEPTPLRYFSGNVRLPELLIRPISKHHVHRSASKPTCPAFLLGSSKVPPSCTRRPLCVRGSLFRLANVCLRVRPRFPVNLTATDPRK